MLTYLISMAGSDNITLFHGTFSEEDVRRLRLGRRGRTFDLESFKAYIDGRGHICLARKPDYVSCATLKYSDLWRHLTEARVAQQF
jgi:hypothetical protein